MIIQFFIYVILRKLFAARKVGVGAAAPRPCCYVPDVLIKVSFIYLISIYYSFLYCIRNIKTEVLRIRKVYIYVAYCSYVPSENQEKFS